MHVCFDFDYTLADSSSGTVACAAYALRSQGRAVPDPTTIRRTVGLSLERTFETLTADAGKHDAAEFKRLFLEHAEQVMLGHIKMYPATAATLAALCDAGHQVSIVSTKLKPRIVEALARDGLTTNVETVIGGGCVARNKPDPEGLLLAIAQTGSSLAHTVYVGDSVSDGAAAQRAGVRFVAVLSGMTEAAALQPFAPVAMLPDIATLPATVAELARS